MGEVRRDDGKRNMFWRSARSWPAPTPVHNARRRLTLAKSARPSQIWAGRGSYPANAGQMVQHDLATMQRAAMLEQIDPLPSAKDQPPRGHGNGKLRLRKRGPDMRRMSSRPSLLWM